MDHNMAKLRAKIITLFKFNPDVEFFLTYTDEDGDLVTLDDDNELRDAVIGQHLNPLRINVQLKSNNSASTDAIANPASAKSSKSTTPPLNVHCAVDEALKAVAEPLRSALSGLSSDVLKVANSQPAFAQFVDYFSKLGLANACQSSNVTTCKSSGGASGASSHLMGLNVSEEPKGSDVPIQESSTTPAVTPATKQQESVNVVQAVGSVDSGSLNLDQDVPKNKNVSPYPFDDLLASISTTNMRLESEKEGDNAQRHGQAVMTSAPFPLLPVSNLLKPGQSFPICGGRIDAFPVDMTTRLPSSFPAHSTQIGVGYGPMSRQVYPPTPPPPYSWPSGVHPYRRSHSYHADAPQNFHRGVQCDVCGMQPIVGSRYKSKVKDDYDLCNFCFSTMGNNEADYMRFDQAVHNTPLSMKCPIVHFKHRFPSSNASHSCGEGPPRVKLESRFIQDVTVSDGTLMVPSTHFTKIWRMRNSGTVAWPFGTQLVWVGGDQLGSHISAHLKIPVNGFPVERELDIAVDFMAPSWPGRFVSYWRMASPSGQKFGQRVWVLIQVDYSKPSTPDSRPHPQLNLNLPPESNNGRTGVGMIDVNVEPLDNGSSESSSTLTSEESVKSVEFAPSGLTQSMPLPVPIIPAAVVPPTTFSSFIDIPSAEVPATDGNRVEQTLLKELEDMGFKQIDLNKEILRQNEYDLEQSVDDLCDYAEWDPLLNELQEMGFADKELNKRLLLKNGGSIKHAVLDLIAGEE